jgi:hypothetical protein
MDKGTHSLATQFQWQRFFGLCRKVEPDCPLTRKISCIICCKNPCFELAIDKKIIIELPPTVIGNSPHHKVVTGVGGCGAVQWQCRHCFSTLSASCNVQSSGSCVYAMHYFRLQQILYPTVLAWGGVTNDALGSINHKSRQFRCSVIAKRASLF